VGEDERWGDVAGERCWCRLDCSAPVGRCGGVGSAGCRWCCGCCSGCSCCCMLWLGWCRCLVGAVCALDFSITGGLCGGVGNAGGGWHINEAAPSKSSGTSVSPAVHASTYLAIPPVDVGGQVLHILLPCSVFYTHFSCGGHAPSCSWGTPQTHVPKASPTPLRGVQNTACCHACCHAKTITNFQKACKNYQNHANTIKKKKTITHQKTAKKRKKNQQRLSKNHQKNY